MLRLLASALVAITVVFGIAPRPVEAQADTQSYLYVSVFDDAVEGRVELPAVDLARIFETDIPDAVADARAALEPLTAPIISYVRDNLRFTGDDGPWELDLDDVLRILPTENGPYVVLGFQIDRDFDSAPDSFTVELSAIIEFDPTEAALLIIEDDWSSATFDNRDEPLLGFAADRTEQVVELGGASTLDSLLAIRGIGSDAIRTAIDSLLIVVGVVAAAVLIPSTRPHRVISAPSVVGRLRTALLALIAGHSATLWIVGLGVLTPSVRLAGILTAVGLGVIAVFVLWGWWSPSMWTVATTVMVGAGTLQGFGLGAAFDTQGLDRRRPFSSLFAFHIGVEIAVAIVVVLVATPLWLLRRTRISSIVTLGLGIALAGYAVGWFLERLVDDDWPIEQIADPLRVWPRTLAVAVIATILAAALRQYDLRAGRLTDLDDAEAEPVPPMPSDRAAADR